MLNIYHEDDILRVFILFVQTGREVLKYADGCLYERANLSVVKLIVLQALVTNGGTMTATELADWTGTARHNITTLIERMKRDGLVTVKRRNIDKRFVSIELTERGRAILRKARPCAWEVVNEVMSSIGNDEARLLEQTLKVLRRNVQPQVKHAPTQTQISLHTE